MELLATAAAVGDILYMQGSKDLDPEGLKVLDKVATGNSDFLGNSIAHLPADKRNKNYTLEVGRRWKAVQKMLLLLLFLQTC